VVSAGVLAALLAVPVGVHAGPTGGEVVAGSGTIQRPDASTTLITQQSHSLAVDWTGFDVASHELVQFQQPSSSAAALNRVFNELPSEIHGRLQANGRIFIMNPNGVIFGPGARVEVGALMASGLDMHVDDFMNGHYRFAAPEGSEPGIVVNRGLISAATGGGVTLLGGAVRNDGVIVANLGHVFMGAGRQALLDFDGDGLIRFQVDGALLSDVAGEGSAVSNRGEIRADGGQVLLSAAVARGVFDRALNNEGVIRAAGIQRSAGAVRLFASGGVIENSGIIDASAANAQVAGSVVLQSDTDVLQRGRIHVDAAEGNGGQVLLEGAAGTRLDVGSQTTARASAGRGGSVQALGDFVTLGEAAVIDVSGDMGGGAVLVGGGYQGADPTIRNARLTSVASGALIRADATGSGDGGRVVVWSDQMTDFFGHISARGGASGGDGGFAEVSGKEQLAFRGTADLRAAQGSRGTLLLDPAFLIIEGGSGDGDGDGSTEQFQGSGATSLAGQILFSDLTPSIVYQSEIEAQSAFADITLQATKLIIANGTFTGGTLALAPDSSLTIEARDKSGGGSVSFVDLTSSVHGADLNIVTSGSGSISVLSGGGGSNPAQIQVPNLISASDIHVSASGGPNASVIVFGTVSGANVDLDANGSVTVVGGGRVVAGGDGTALTIDASGITLNDGLPGAATVANSGTGTVSLVSTGAANIVLGENAIATGVGLLSLGSGGSIVAVNLTDVTDTVNEIISSGTVSLQAADGIGSNDAHVEIAGVTDLIVDVGEGSIFLSGSDGVGGAGAPLSSLTLSLEPDEDGQYVVDNFTGQTFAFAQGDFDDDLVIREITSATLLDLSIRTEEEGMIIGGGGDPGIQLAGAGNVTLDSEGVINEAVVDDPAQVVAEITTDGRVTLVAKKGIGTSGMLDLAAGPSGISTLEARSDEGVVRVNGLDALRVAGSGVDAAGGGTLMAAKALTISADVESSGDMSFVAGNDAASAGNDLRIEAGSVVKLDSSVAATLRFDAGDHIALDGGRIETAGAAGHRVELHADQENDGSDGVTGRVTQTGIAASVSGGHLDVIAGGGVGIGTPLRTQVTSLSVDNTTAGEVQVINAGDVTLVGGFRNQAPGEVLDLVVEDGSIDTGSAEVASNAGRISLDARASSATVVADITLGAGGLRSAGADVTLRAADAISLRGLIETGDGGLSLEAGSAIEQPSGRIVAASLVSGSGGDTTLASVDNAIDRLTVVAGGGFALGNGVALSLGNTDVTGDLRIDNGGTLSLAAPVVVGGRATLTTTSGNIDAAGGRIQAAELSLDSAGGIGIGTALDITDISGDLFLRSRGTGADGDIRLEARGDFATRRLQRLATDTASAQTVSLRTDGVLTVDEDPIDSPDMASGDRLELEAVRFDLAEKISGDDVDVTFKGPVEVIDSMFIDLDEGLLTFEDNVSPASTTTLTIGSEVVFASGHVTGGPDSSLVVEGTLNLATDTVIEIDSLRLSGDPASLTGDGNLTLLPATHGMDIVLGGPSGFAPDVTMATLQNFGGGRTLEIGAPTLPTANAPFAGNVRVVQGVSVGDAVLTVGGLGDVTLANHGTPLASDRVVNVIAVGDDQVFPDLVDHAGGNILDTDASVGAPVTLRAPEINLIAQGAVGSEINALVVDVGSGGSANFVTGAADAFINTVPAGADVNNVADSSEILDAYQELGFFQEPLNQGAPAQTVGLETTGLETTGLGELLYIDEGVFLLPDPYTTPVQATLLPGLMDPNFPVDLRPGDASDGQAWQSFYSGVLKDYVQSRYPQLDEISESERAEIQDRIEIEWQSLVEYFEAIRSRERAATASGSPGGG
jgi:filamentous hemagglutinin family protein